MAGFGDMFKSLLLFNEPKRKEEGFILKETNFEKEATGESKKDKKNYENTKKEEAAEQLKAFENDNQEKIKKEVGEEKASEISRKLDDNLQKIKKLYTVPTNSDVILREFDIIVKDKAIPAFIIFFDGMVDRKVINDNILQPLMLLSNLDIKASIKEVATYIKKQLVPHNQIREVKEFRKILDEVNFGSLCMFVDGLDVAFTSDVKGFEHRGVERPNTELVIRGPQEGFTELIRTNTALIRKRMKDEDLIVENIEIGKRSKTPCSLMYVKDIVNKSLVDETRRRLKGIKIDYLNDSGELEQLIEDKSIIPIPQVTSSERPDFVANMLAEGKVAVVVHGSPFVLVLPTTYYELLHSPEDNYIRFPYANLLRSVRFLAMVLSIMLPGIYIAITNFHHEMIPTDLLIAIEAAREKVPFPSIVEILIMEIAFELIREAGIRVPGPIGPTLGIIGALILGQAAVAANIVSPILIIIVAVTGISSFAIPNFSLSFSFRILRFIYILLGVIAGFLGIGAGLFFIGLWVVSAKSFGVPYLSGFGPTTSTSYIKVIARPLSWMQEKRADFLNTMDEFKQPKISREWTKDEDKEDNNGRS